MVYKILERIKAGIEEGEYDEEGIPSENELAQRYGVPRMTARRALVMLEDMGYAFSRQGKGRFPSERRRTIALNLSGAESFSTKLTRAGVGLETCACGLGPVRLPTGMRTRLGASEEEITLGTRRLRIMNGKPAAIHFSYLRASLFPDASDEAWRYGSLFAYFTSRGYSRFASTGSSLGIAYPDAEERELLGCPPLVPLLEVETDTVDAESGTVLQVARTLYRCDIFKYTIG